MAIHDWPEDERPREKLLTRGAAALSDAELLAIFLRMGVSGKSAVDLARDMLLHFGNLNGIFTASAQQFCEIKGLGPAKFTQFQAVLEMTKRALAEQLKARTTLSSPNAVRDFLRLQIGNRPYEVFMVLYLDAQNRLITSEEAFRGTLTQTSVYPREIARCALENQAASVIFAHNHPSGVAEPSQADRHLTKTLKQALAMLDIATLDHFIVTQDSIFSFAETGLL
ncbi:RadC family protein [Ampullimonas aquatilis]|uniref:RadC family protein n=1 Tax=Ampullimonas aquatilis TaxID=1341549 RepID=UPI003C746D2A